ncbi:uncharacterized protein METZ01_LOCUS195314, partial [marine metagenome]
MGRFIGWNEKYFIKMLCFADCLRNQQMTNMGWIKGTTKKTDSHC